MSRRNVFRLTLFVDLPAGTEIQIEDHPETGYTAWKSRAPEWRTPLRVWGPPYDVQVVERHLPGTQELFDCDGGDLPSLGERPAL